MATVYGSNIDGAPAGDQVNDISHNRTLLAAKCTQQPDNAPKIVKGLQNVAAVFEHYQPEHTIFFEKTDSAIQKETFSYKDLEDFEKPALIKRSRFLQQLQEEKELNLRIAKETQTNTQLQQIMSDTDAKKALLKKIKSLKETLRK